MKYSWLIKQNRKQLVVFFSGWGMDENAIAHLKSENYDCLVLFDYSELDMTLDKKSFDLYEKIVVAGFSMGVWALCLLQNLFPQNKTEFMAFCGTPFPVHDEYGIPQSVFDLTLKGLTPEGLEKFQRRMFDRPSDFDRFKQSKPERGFENLKTELSRLKEHVSNRALPGIPVFSRVFIPERDRIIPEKNQARYWKEHKGLTVLKCGHFPFYCFDSLDQMLNGADNDR